MKFDLGELIGVARDLEYHRVVPDIESRLRDAFTKDPSGCAASRVMMNARKEWIKRG